MFLDNTMDSKVNLKAKHHLKLKSDEIHIWTICLLNKKKNISYLSSLLSKDEQKKAANFKFLRDREQFLITRGILRCVLAGYLKEIPQAINIHYGLWGKPCLSEEKTLHFNVSHSGDYALFAFARDYEIGIDLEQVNENLELEEIALTIFSQTELSYWKKIPPEEKINFFFKFWVGKEAFLKALGKGWLENDENTKFEELCSFKKNLNCEVFKNKFGFVHYFEGISGYKSAYFVKGPTLQPTFFSWEYI